MIRILAAAATLTACSGQGVSMESKCAYFDVFGTQVINVRDAFQNPKIDAYRLYKTNGKYNLIFLPKDGAGSVPFLDDEMIIEEVSGLERFRDPVLGEKLRIVSNASKSKIDVNLIGITEELINKNLKNLIGENVSVARECYEDALLVKYVREFNSTSLDIAVKRMRRNGLR